MQTQKIKRLIFSISVILILSPFPIFALAEQTFTPEELAKYYGKDGAKAYIAVKGRVYDLTGYPQWAGGNHFCPGAVAGKDLTAIWGRSPVSHFDTDFLKRFPEVGRLVVVQVQPQTSPTPMGSPTPTELPRPTVKKRQNDPSTLQNKSENRNGIRINPAVWGLVIIGAGILIWFFLRPRRK